ncbi:MAG: type II toxin-antitoxin system VapC family toxin [Micrococcales bacterium]|nr:type II toxin-antitoxin system VapC family toxin [Micrococcales bacterium]
MAETRVWYVDSSVLLRAIVEQSPAARTWFENAAAAGDRFVASRLMELEVRRVTKNAGVDQNIVSEWVDEFLLMSVTDELLSEAIALDVPLGVADSIHVASALRLGPTVVTLVTHDRQMATGATALGFDVHDPVTDDPGRGPVA